jgi:hypothetical protein
MRKKITLRIMLVREGHGIGIQTEDNADQLMNYDGIRLRDGAESFLAIKAPKSKTHHKKRQLCGSVACFN